MKQKDREMPAEQHYATKDEMSLPPRSSLHPSGYIKAIRWFYRTLLSLFILLVIGLTFWGMGLFE